MNTRFASSASNRRESSQKRRWLKPLIVLALGVWVCFHLVKILGVETLAQAGWHIQHNGMWVTGLLLLRVLVYSSIIIVLRNHLRTHQFKVDEIKHATLMSVRVFIAYELLIGLNLIGHLNDWLRA